MHLTTSKRLRVLWMLPALLLVALAAGPAVAKEAPAPAAPEPVERAAAEKDLKTLGDYIKKKKSSNDDLLAFLDSVGGAYQNLVAPEPPDADAGEEEKKLYDMAVKRHEKAQADFNRAAEKLLLKGFTLVKASRDGKTNLRDDVNMRAAEVIATIGPRMEEKRREALAKKLMGAIDKLGKAKHELSAPPVEAGFAALATLGGKGELMWLCDNYLHTKSQPSDLVPLLGSLKAMVLFKKPAGEARYEIVKKMVKLYSGTERQADQTKADPKIQAAKAFWDQVRVDVIKVLQTFCGDSAATDDGQVFNRVGDFEEWFREHKNKKKAPWVDA